MDNNNEYINKALVGKTIKIPKTNEIITLTEKDCTIRPFTYGTMLLLILPLLAILLGIVWLRNKDKKNYFV